MFSKAIFLDVLVVYLFVRYLSNHRQSEQRQTRKPYSNKPGLVLDTLTDLALIPPMVYIFTPWLDFAGYYLPAWSSLAGVLLFIVALWIIGKAYFRPGTNYPTRVEIGDKHSLVSQGIYRYIRHPIYAGFWLWSIAQPLLLHNWIAGFAMLATFLPLYWVRVPREERMLLERFGESYRGYMKETGRVVPRITLNLHRSDNGGGKASNIQQG
jgi:protein-S-isoprenylcysteine O-methyltransferase Ste14